MKKSNRRHFLKHSAQWFGGAPLLAMPLSAGAQSIAPQRFVHFFLRGGWDSALATDPIIGSKASSSVYHSNYQNLQVATVTGKSNLTVGQGLLPAVSAFSAMPTCFINGVWVEVTAHELAQNYVYSGVKSLSRSREYPSVTSRIGNASGHFPPFLAIGAPVPLGELEINPPLHSLSPDQFDRMLNPFDENVPPAVIQTAQSLLDDLNQGFLNGGNTALKDNLLAWRNSQSRISELYEKDFNLSISQDIMDRYSLSNPWEEMARIAAAFTALKSGISPYVTCSFEGYDTHASHFATHTDLMSGFAQRLATFVADLSQTPDPSGSGEMLSQTTTILISSEFVRTPTLNASQGTDHWQSASMIMMGPRVRDNIVHGRTDDQAHAMGWVQGSAVPRTEETALTPERIQSGIIKHFSSEAVSSEVSGSPFDDLFI